MGVCLSPLFLCVDVVQVFRLLITSTFKSGLSEIKNLINSVIDCTQLNITNIKIVSTFIKMRLV